MKTVYSKNTTYSVNNLIYQNFHKHSIYTNPIIVDSCAYPEDYAKRAAELGHGIISSVEHGYQGRYIESFEMAEKYNLKYLFGVEAYFVPDKDPCVFFSQNQSIDTEYCVFDLETTGLSAANGDEPLQIAIVNENEEVVKTMVIEHMEKLGCCTCNRCNQKNKRKKNILAERKHNSADNNTYLNTVIYQLFYLKSNFSDSFFIKPCLFTAGECFTA